MKKRICLFLALLLTLPALLSFASESVFGTPMKYEARSGAGILPDGRPMLAGGRWDKDPYYAYIIQPGAENGGEFSQIYQLRQREGRSLFVVPGMDGTAFINELAFESGEHGEEILGCTLRNVNAEGKILWEREIGPLNWQICPTGSDELFLLGTFPFTGDPDLAPGPRILCLSGDGELFWEQTYDDLPSFCFLRLYPVSDGYLFYGTHWGDNVGMLGKLDREGSLLWIKQPSESKMLEIAGIVLMEDEGALVFGFDETDGKIRNKAWQYSAEGELLRSEEYADIGASLFRDATAYGDVILVALDALGKGVSFAIIDLDGMLLSTHRFETEPNHTFDALKVLADGGKAYMTFVQTKWNPDGPTYDLAQETVVIPLLLEEANLR